MPPGNKLKLRMYRGDFNKQARRERREAKSEGKQAPVPLRFDEHDEYERLSEVRDEEE